jgi:hypothetical protein
MSIISSVQNEFWFHVSNQSEIPIFGEIDKSPNLPLLVEIIQNLPQQEKQEKVENSDDIGELVVLKEMSDNLAKFSRIKQTEYISQLIVTNPKTVDILRTLIGVSDKRMYLELSYIFAKTKFNNFDTLNILDKPLYELDKHDLKYFQNLLKSTNKRLAEKSAEIISNYLIDKQLIEILLVFRKLNENELSTIINKLILPKEIKQAEAKRRGHGAEHYLAQILKSLGVSLIPQDRHLDPMKSKDPNVNKNTFEITNKKKGETWSFDLVIEDLTHQPLIFLQSLIHTSDPGQYGVNKSDETVAIKKDLTKYNQKQNSNKELWGLVDGVGFCENKKDTIDKMLAEFDCFIQMKTLYKAGLKLHQLGLIDILAIRFDLDFYTLSEAEEMYSKYGCSKIKMITNNCHQGQEIKAGKAWLYV